MYCSVPTECIAVFVYAWGMGIVMVVIVWQLDLQLHVQSVTITTKVVILKSAHGEVYFIQHYVTDQWFSMGTLISSTNKTEISVKMV